ncbi:HD-GYP domain-containing protein [Gottfriedia luciferensis]|uniref:HD-GYP domain-containing protein n=1 Tax=Gottfriedia luciferensis TaxID=178774 RepID=UPI001302AA69|nr:HD-GYP domain-containing protein [Gottfriedia luciferensis]
MNKNINVSFFNTRKNPLVISLSLILIPIGVLLDFYIFRDRTLILTYIPMMIAVGLFFQSTLSIILFSFVSTILLFINSPEEWTIEVSLARWLFYFLIAFVIKILIDNLRKEKETLINLTSTLAVSLDARDQYTAFHSRNVAYYSREIARAMNKTTKICDDIYIGGLLHDIGKIGVPESILNKPSRLTEREFNQIKQHPQIGYDILQYISYFKKNGILDIVLYHHEKYDGTGYPYGLKGENIPLVARIISVSDAFDAMTSQRTYRERNTIEHALQEIRNGRGKQFDPYIANVFLNLIERGQIDVCATNNEPMKQES